MRTKIIIAFSVIVLVLSGFFVGAACLPVFQVPAQSTDRQIVLEGIEEVWDRLAENYVDTSLLDAEKLKDGAIEGMLKALDDPYTSYLNPEDYEAQLLSLQGKYQGIGAYVGFRDGHIVIIAPIPGSPAEKAGIRSGDVILEIDGESASDLSLEEAVLQIRGTAGTSVTLTVLHEDEEEPVIIPIVRSEIQPETVTWEKRGDIAYIRISHFVQPSAGEFDSVIAQVKSEEGLKGMILDLRSNPGGLLDSVVDIASHFVDEGVVTYVVDSEGKRNALEADPAKDKIKLPSIVLVNEYSASGSEVLSGALRDHDMAILAGTTTFGKGSVNIIQQLSTGGALYITTSRWLTPNGTLIEGQGLEPDCIIDLAGDELIDWAIRYLHGEEDCSPQQ